MDMYKLKFTSLQLTILRYLSLTVGVKYNKRRLAIELGVSPTAISKALQKLVKGKLVKLTQDKFSKNYKIELNFDNFQTIKLKRVYNLQFIYESGLAEYLIFKHPGCTVIMFGSFSRGEDTIDSDIDIAVIGCDEKKLDLHKYVKSLLREINVMYFKNWDDMGENLLINLRRGIYL
jgi:predicted nucleotidyltransferase